MKLFRPARETADDAGMPTSRDAVQVDAVDPWFAIDRLPVEVKRSFHVFLLAASTVELRHRRSALVRELATYLIEDGPAPTT